MRKRSRVYVESRPFVSDKLVDQDFKWARVLRSAQGNVLQSTKHQAPSTKHQVPLLQLDAKHKVTMVQPHVGTRPIFLPSHLLTYPIQPHTEDWQGGRDKERTSSAQMVLRASVIADITEITRSNCSAQTYKPRANV